MAEYDLVYAATLITVVFCALVFSTLAASLWSEKGLRRSSPLAAFTVVCAAAFALNLLATIKPAWSGTIAVALDLTTGMLPPLLLHLASQDPASEGRRSHVRRAFYGVSAIAALALALDDAGLASIPFAESIPALLLGTAGLLGQAMLFAADRSQAMWYRVLFALTAIAAVAGLVQRSEWTALAPDYLLLAVFCVTLYYQERLVFFDLILKRGAFFFLALAALTAFFLVYRLTDALSAALLLTPFLLAAPAAERILGRSLDRLFLRRRYSDADAERLFTTELQAAPTEAALRVRAADAMADIFGAPAEISFVPAAPPAEDRHAMTSDLRGLGLARVPPRASGIPFMVGDRRLFQSLTATLAVVLENVRFREREEQLRLLASRAELKALRAQINPHFLFNALNAIAGLIPSQPELADETVERLAHVFRYTLRKSENEWVRLDEEVEFVTAYLRVEQARFGARLAVDIAVDDRVAGVLVPSMCLQPLVENALKHGVAQVEGRGEIRVVCAVAEVGLTITVCDNGPGFPFGFTLSGSQGHALRNIADRLRGYYGEMGRLTWESPAGATRVSLEIPLDTAAKAAKGL
jgi:signal transduction histidine kinase